MLDENQAVPVPVRPFPFRAVEMDTSAGVVQTVGIVITSFASRMLTGGVSCFPQDPAVRKRFLKNIKMIGRPCKGPAIALQPDVVYSRAFSPVRLRERTIHASGQIRRLKERLHVLIPYGVEPLSFIVHE